MSFTIVNASPYSNSIWRQLFAVQEANQRHLSSPKADKARILHLERHGRPFDCDLEES